MPYLYLCFAFVLNGVANILLKNGSKSSLVWDATFKEIIFNNWQTLLGLIIFASNIIFYYLALKSLPLSIAYPIMVAASFIIVNLYSYLVIKETIVMTQLIGYLFIILGVILVLFFAKQ